MEVRAPARYPVIVHQNTVAAYWTEAYFGDFVVPPLPARRPLFELDAADGWAAALAHDGFAVIANSGAPALRAELVEQTQLLRRVGVPRVGPARDDARGTSGPRHGVPPLPEQHGRDERGRLGSRLLARGQPGLPRDGVLPTRVQN